MLSNLYLNKFDKILPFFDSISGDKYAGEPQKEVAVSLIPTFSFDNPKSASLI